MKMVSALIHCIFIAVLQMFIPSIATAQPAISHNADSVYSPSSFQALIEDALRHQANNPEKALHLIRQALKIAYEDTNFHHQGIATAHLAECYFRLSDYAVAVEKATDALQLAQKINDNTVLAMAHRVLGLIYTLGLKQYDKALEHQLKAFELYKVLKDPEKIAAFCGNITWIYAITGKNLEEAHRLVNKGIHLSDSLNDFKLLSYNHNSKGLIYKTQHKYDSALYHFERSNQAAYPVNDLAVIAYNKQLMGEIALGMKNIKQALSLFNESAEICARLKLREILKDDHSGLAQAYASLGNFSKAYFHFRRFTELKDSLLNWEITQRTLLVSRQADEEQQKKQLAAFEQAARQAQREQLIVSVSFAIVFVLMSTVLILVLRNNRYRKLLNKALEEKNRQIEEQNKKLKDSSALRDKLFSIISHDLRSPLASLRGMLRLLQKEKISESEFRLYAPKIGQLLTGMSETLENLLSWGQSQLSIITFQPVRLFPYDVVKRIFDLFADMADGKNITLKNHIDPLLEITCDRNLLELVLRNLIHNSIKFSNPGGEVVISASTDKEYHIIKVADNGIGMSAMQRDEILVGTPETKRGTMGEKGTGLGLRLCIDLLKQSGGYLEVESEEGKGSAFRVYLKVMR